MEDKKIYVVTDCDCIPLDHRNFSIWWTNEGGKDDPAEIYVNTGREMCNVYTETFDRYVILRNGSERDGIVFIVDTKSHMHPKGNERKSGSRKGGCAS